MSKTLNAVLPKVNSSNTFHAGVADLVKKYRLSYIEAVISFCDQTGLELEAAASMIKSNSKAKLAMQSEGESLNFLAKKVVKGVE